MLHELHVQVQGRMCHDCQQGSCLLSPFTNLQRVSHLLLNSLSRTQHRLEHLKKRYAQFQDCSVHSILYINQCSSTQQCVPTFCEWMLLGSGQDWFAWYIRKQLLLLLLLVMPE